ncbi:MAG: ABC transporter permease [bacterium]
MGYWRQVLTRLSRNRLALVCGVFVAALVAVSALAPYITPYAYNEAHLGPESSYQPPSLKYWMGTDDLGRDLFSRLIYSLRNALIISLGGTFLSLLIGGFLGAWAGYAGGRTDFIIMRFTDVVFAFPSFLFSIILVSGLGRGFPTMFLAVGATSWVGMARLMRGQVISVKGLEYVELARSLGASGFHIITKYILPNTLGPLIVTITFSIPGGMMVESGLSMLGMGVQPPIPSFGTIIADGAAAMRSYPHLLVFPSVLFTITLMAFTFLGDGLQDALSMNRKGD